MLREILIKNLNEQLDYLTTEHVEDLMKARREEELLDIINEGIKIGKLNFTIFEDYCQLTKLNCRISEISDRIYEFILYLNQSEIEDRRFYFSDADVIEALCRKNEPVAMNIAKTMKDYVLSTVKLHDILFEGAKENRGNITLREYVLNDWKEQLEYLASEHVADLMKAKREEELKEIINEGIHEEKLRFKILKDYCNITTLRLTDSEIPKDRIYEAILYLNQLGIEDYNIFWDHHKIQLMLLNLNEPVATNIAKLMNLDNLYYLTLNQLLFEKR